MFDNSDKVGKRGHSYFDFVDYTSTKSSLFIKKHHTDMTKAKLNLSTYKVKYHLL